MKCKGVMDNEMKMSKLHLKNKVDDVMVTNQDDEMMMKYR